MPNFANRIAALNELTAHLEAFAASVSTTMDAANAAVASGGDQILGKLDSVAAQGNPRLADFKRDLESLIEEGNRWAEMLLDSINQVEQGTIRADQAINKFGDGLVLFEGQLVHADTLLLKFLPTTGQVAARIEELRKQLVDADIGALIEKLNEQYNVYALELAKAVEAYKAGKGSLERIAALAQQINDRLPGSETDALADEIRDRLLGGTL